MIKLKLITILLLFFLATNSCQQKANKLVSENCDTKNIIKVDLDTCKYEEVRYNDFFKSHKGLHSLGAKDTMIIADNIYSIKTAKYQFEEGDNNYTLSQIEVFYNEEMIFTVDSVLTSGMCFYETNNNLLAIPIILNQNTDDFSTETFIYILDLSKKTYWKIDDVLTNCSFSFICSSGKKIIFNNSDQVILYDLLNNKAETVINFDNPFVRIIKILYLKDNTLDIFYSNDFANDFLFKKPMKKTTITLSQNLCE